MMKLWTQLNNIINTLDEMPKDRYYHLLLTKADNLAKQLSEKKEYQKLENYPVDKF